MRCLFIINATIKTNVKHRLPCSPHYMMLIAILHVYGTHYIAPWKCCCFMSSGSFHLATTFPFRKQCKLYTRTIESHVVRDVVVLRCQLDEKFAEIFRCVLSSYVLVSAFNVNRSIEIGFPVPFSGEHHGAPM